MIKKENTLGHFFMSVWRMKPSMARVLGACGLSRLCVCLIMGRPEREGLPFLLKSNRFAAMHIMIIIHPSSPLLPYRLGINMFADGKLRKLQGSAIVKRMPYSASPIYGRAPDFLLKEDPLISGRRAGQAQAAGATQVSNPS